MSNQKFDQGYATTASGDSKADIKQIKKLYDTIEVQRKIIAEQAARVKELQEKLKKYGWKM